MYWIGFVVHDVIHVLDILELRRKVVLWMLVLKVLLVRFRVRHLGLKVIKSKTTGFRMNLLKLVIIHL